MINTAYNNIWLPAVLQHKMPCNLHAICRSTRAFKRLNAIKNKILFKSKRFSNSNRVTHSRLWTIRGDDNYFADGLHNIDQCKDSFRCDSIIVGYKYTWLHGSV